MKNNLEQLRAEKSISQIELADAMEVSRQTISSLENGRYNPSIVLAFKLAKYFDKTIEAIVIGDKTKEIDTKNKEKMMFITASDELATTTIVIFPKTYQTISQIEIGDILKITGRVEKRFDKYQIIATKITKLN